MTLESVRDVRFGVAHSTLELAVAMGTAPAGHELVVYSTVMGENLFNHSVSHAGVRARSVYGSGSSPGRQVRHQLLLPIFARRDRLDVLFCPAYAAPLLASVPLVLGVHDVLVLEHPALCTFGNRAHLSWLLPRLLRRATRIIVPSADVMERAARLTGDGEARVRVVQPGVRSALLARPTPDAVASLRRRLGLHAEFALLPANVEPKKNLGRLIRAFASARPDRPPGILVVTGGADWGDRADERFVRRLGHVGESDFATLLHAARVVVFPSLAEGFGLPVIEAMAAGVPVVCSDVPAVREAGSHAALVVDPLSVEDIARAIRSAWTDAAVRQRLVADGHAASARFRWESSAARTWRVIEEAHADGRVRRGPAWRDA